MSEIVYGRWAAMETIRAGRRAVQQMLLAEGVEDKGIILDLLAVAQERSVPVKRLARRVLGDLGQDGNHQGVVLRVGPYPYAELDTGLALAQERQRKPLPLII